MSPRADTLGSKLILGCAPSSSGRAQWWPTDLSGGSASRERIPGNP